MTHPLDYFPNSTVADLGFGALTVGQIVSLPKLDLHRHLIGSIRAEVLVYVANKLGILLTGSAENDADQIRKTSVISKPMEGGYEHFLRKRIWKQYKEIFSDISGIHNTLYWAVADAARDGVIYVEFRVSPNCNEFNPNFNLSLREYLSSFRKALDAAQRDFPETIARIVLSVGRNAVMERWGDESERRRRFDKLIETSQSYRDIVVGFDITGNEESYPNPYFVDFARRVKSAGFPLTVHAGETGRAESVWDAINLLNADRIGHGLGSVNDEALMDYIAEHGIPLELCPTSNLMLGVVETMEKYPCRIFLNRGIRISVNTDDPVLLGPTTMSQEFHELLDSDQIKAEDISRISYMALDSSFASEEDKSKLRLKLDRQFKSNQIALRTKGKHPELLVRSAIY